jgi:hypothetical protein
MAGSGRLEAERCLPVRHSATAALDPYPDVHDHDIERLIAPKATIPLSGSRNDRKHDRRWVGNGLAALLITTLPPLVLQPREATKRQRPH